MVRRMDSCIPKSTLRRGQHPSLGDSMHYCDYSDARYVELGSRTVRIAEAERRAKSEDTSKDTLIFPRTTYGRLTTKVLSTLHQSITSNAWHRLMRAGFVVDISIRSNRALPQTLEHVHFWWLAPARPRHKAQAGLRYPTSSCRAGMAM